MFIVTERTTSPADGQISSFSRQNAASGDVRFSARRALPTSALA
jgi:hypothetical protein